MSAYESRPVAGAASESPATTTTTSIRDATDVARLSSRTGYVVRAVTTLTNGRSKVYHFASLHSAVKAKERAEARGCIAVLSLCTVAPVGVITDAELASLAALAGDVA